MSHESIDKQHKPSGKRRSSAVLDTSDVQIDIDMDDDDDDDVHHDNSRVTSNSLYTNGDCTDSGEDMDTSESFDDKTPQSVAAAAVLQSVGDMTGNDPTGWYS